MNPQASSIEPKHRKKLTRDQRLKIKALRKYGLSIRETCDELGVTKRQVQYTCNQKEVRSEARLGRPPKLSPEQVDELEAFVTSSTLARRMTYLELTCNHFSHWNCGIKSIRSALLSRGYRRSLVRTRPREGKA